jgi:ABC-type multidrug transport system ATPase subunit
MRDQDGQMTNTGAAAIPANEGSAQEGGLSLLLRGLRKSFADVVAVDGLDLEVMRGECFGLLGPNGAGKTTTIEICEGLTAPDSGTVELLGLNWIKAEKELRQRIGIQLQETQFPEKLTVDETLRLFRSFFYRGLSVEQSIKTAQLEEKRHARVGTLSGGQKQRLAMACALVGDPELLFLDEPTTGLDPQARRHLWDLVDGLKQAGRTIILTTHYMDEAWTHHCPGQPAAADCIGRWRAHRRVRHHWPRDGRWIGRPSHADVYPWCRVAPHRCGSASAFRT